MILHPLRKQVRAVGRQAHRLLLVQRLCWWAALNLLVTLSIGLCDYLVRPQDPIVRGIGYSMVVCCWVVTCWRMLLLPLLRKRASDLLVAQLIERRFPQLQGRLSSSLAFLAEPSPSSQRPMGSPTLQESVIAETDRLVATLNISECLEGRRARRAIGGFVLVAFVTGLLCALDLPAAGIILRRLAKPLHGEPWPQWNQLEFVDPPRVMATGSDFEARLVDRNGHLPASATFEIKLTEDDEPAARVIQQVDGQLVARLTNVTQGLLFRARGGDDRSMAWHALEVREPVQISNLEIIVHPPAYTGLPPEKASRLIRAWAGSELRIAGQLSAAVESVTIESTLTTAPEVGLSPDGKRFQIPADASPAWTPHESGQIEFRIQDRGGLVVTSDLRCDVTVVEDLAPEVVLESPQENDAFLPGAEIPIRVTIKDDLAIRSADLVHLDKTWPLLAVSEQDSQPTATAPGSVGERRTIDSTWDLEGLNLEAGDSVEYHIVATDNRPQTGTSSVRRLTIISVAEFDAELDRDQGELRQRIEKSLALQRQTHSQTERLVSSVDWANSIPDAETLQATQWGQQQIRQLISGPNGARPLAESLLRRLATNRVDRPDVAARLHAAHQQLLDLDAAILPGIEHELASTVKVAKTASRMPNATDRSLVHRSLESSQQTQQQVVDALEAILARFAKWSNVRRITSDVTELRQQQRQLIQATDSLDTVGKKRRDLTDTEVDLLEQLADRQAQLARQTDRVLSEIEQLQQGETSSDPTLQTMLRRAIQAARENDLASAAHQAQRSLRENQIGTASAQQRAVQAGLEAISDAISQHPKDPRAALLDRVQGWLKRQVHLSNRTQEMLNQDDPGTAPADVSVRRRTVGALVAEQEGLAGQVADAVAMQPSPVVRYILGEANELMGKAARLLSDAKHSPSALELQRGAEAKLLRLADALQPPRPNAITAAGPPGDPTAPPDDSQPTGQRISLADLQLLRIVQLEIYQRTSQIDQARQATGRLSADQQADMAELAVRQEKLADLVSSLLGQRETPASQAPATTTPDLDDALRKANIPGFIED